MIQIGVKESWRIFSSRQLNHDQFATMHGLELLDCYAMVVRPKYNHGALGRRRTQRGGMAAITVGFDRCFK